MAGTFLRLLVVLLCFSQLIIFLNAIPITRTRSLEHKSQGYGGLSAKNHMANANYKKWNMMRRMDVELNDYPGSGANNRHTPKQQIGRGCVDC